MPNLFVSRAPVGVDAIGGYPSLPSLPKEWDGSALRWERAYRPTPVFIGQVRACHEKGSRRDWPAEDVSLWLFGFRIDLAKAACKTAELPEGHVIEYIVISTESPTPPRLHHLRQTESVTYSEIAVPEDYQLASAVSAATAPCVNDLPRWKAQSASWPTFKGKAMTFIRQWCLPQNAVTSKYLGYDMSVFLFGAQDDKRMYFSITTQRSDVQTADRARKGRQAPISHAELRDLFERLDLRSMTGYECDHTYALTTKFLQERELPIEPVLAWLGENGAGCDCEVMFNVAERWERIIGYVPPGDGRRSGARPE